MAEQLSPTELLLHIQTVEEVTEKLGHFTKEQLNEVDNGKTCLTMAVVSGRADFIPPLVKLGCDPNRSFGGGITPLLLATKLRRVDAVVALCEAGADPHHAADQGPSSLSLALAQGDCDTYAVLARHFVQAHEEVDRPLAEFEALRASVAKGSPEFVEGLLQATKELRVTDRVVTYCARDGIGSVMEVLLAHGGSPNAMERGQQDIPAVVLASALGNLSCLVALLSTQTPVDLEMECFGLTPLMHAAKDGHAECCQLLLERGAKVDALRLPSGWTPLFFACNNGKQSTVRLLLERGANPRIVDSVGQTALHVCSSPRIVETLLRYGADPNTMDNELRTCLFRPALVADYMAIMHLVRFGADPLLAHAAHVQRVTNLEKGGANNPDFKPAKAEDVRALLPTVTGPVDPVLWLPTADRELLLKEYKDEQEMGMGKRTRLDLARDLLNRGFVWIRWTTANHRLFPANVRRTIFTCLLCRKRRESPLSLLPRDLLLLVCSFVATPSPEWRESARGNLREWDWSKTFSDRCWEFDVANMVPEKVAKLLEMRQCTKNLTGVDFLFQPFYKCLTCKWGEEFGNNLGMCRSCRDACHQGHETQVCGFLPAFCDCGDSARCCLASQWSLLANEKESIDPETDGNEQYRYVIAICHFHDPAVFRELHRPENLMHAVPGDVIKVERAKLDQPGLLCEGTLHGEKGVFPASRSYVLPMREFVRALEDSSATGPAAADGRELKFKTGDLILPLGRWEENAPQCRGLVFKGRVISPDGDQAERWFSHYSCDLVVNFDVFQKDGVNLKRRLLEQRDAAMALAEAGDPEAVLALMTFMKEFQEQVGKRRDVSFFLASSYFEAGLSLAAMFRLLLEHKVQCQTLLQLCTDLDASIESGDDRSLIGLRVNARACLVMALRRQGDAAGYEVWKQMVNKEEIEKDKNVVGALWRLGTFCFLEMIGDSPDALTHLERLRSGLVEARVKESHDLWKLYMELRVAADLSANKLGDALRDEMERVQHLESHGRPLELFPVLVRFGTRLLQDANNPAAAERILERALQMWADNAKWNAFPELVNVSLEAMMIHSQCLERMAVRAQRGAMGLLCVSDVKRCALLRDGINLIARVHCVPGGYGVRVLCPLERRPAGTMFVYMEQPHMPVPFKKTPIYEIPLQEGWLDQMLVIDFDSQVAAKVKIMLVADDIVIGKVSIILVPRNKNEEKEEEAEEAEKNASSPSFSPASPTYSPDTQKK